MFNYNTHLVADCNNLRFAKLGGSIASPMWPALKVMQYIDTEETKKYLYAFTPHTKQTCFGRSPPQGPPSTKTHP